MEELWKTDPEHHSNYFASEESYLLHLGRLKDQVKDFEEQFLLEMEKKHPEILGEFKKGNLPDDGLKKMTELASHIAAQFK